MAQTRLGSFAEALANIAVGFGINYAANLIVLPWFGFNVNMAEAFGIGAIFTAISLARSYVLRRWFNGLRLGNTSTARATFDGSTVERAGRKAMGSTSR